MGLFSAKKPAWEEDAEELAAARTHPVLAAAFDAGVNTPEKFAAMKQHAEISHDFAAQVAALTAERDALKPFEAAHTAAQETALTAKRTEAKASARFAFGMDAAGLAAAEGRIDAASGEALTMLAEAYEIKAEAVAPAAGWPRQTSAAASSDIEPATDAAGNMAETQMAVHAKTIAARTRGKSWIGSARGKKS